jgi:16S rRNA G966 N2-methylase RsmD
MADSLRILRGSLRGRKVAVPPAVHGNSHLTLGLVKEAVFQILEGRLGGDLSQWAFFDLCAGSGQMAIEAHSLGFAPVHLSEIDPGRLRHLFTEKRLWDYPLTIHKRDFRRMAPLLLEFPRVVAFLDPPYSFWEHDGSSPAVQRLVHNILNGTPAGPCDLRFIVHGRAFFQPDARAGEGMQIVASEERDYRGQRLTFLDIAPLDAPAGGRSDPPDPGPAAGPADPDALSPVL